MKKNLKEKKTRAKGCVVAGLGGGTGKSVVTVGLIAALRDTGIDVAPFKKGPDYIDAGWLSLAAGRPCFNLDPYLVSRETLRLSFAYHLSQAPCGIVEGNRGIFDGVDVEGGYSTAELAVMLGLPALLVVDCTKVTRTVAAMVLGCREFDKRLAISGVILNRIARSRHEDLVAQAVERYTGIPVLGALPKMPSDAFPQRHLGVTPFQEHGDSEKAVRRLAEVIARHVDLDRVTESMGSVRLREKDAPDALFPVSFDKDGDKVRIGVIRDAAFQFYYPENLLALAAAGAEVVQVNALEERELPPLDGLYIGGGFPETSIGRLANNRSFRESVRLRAEEGLPIYAECGGLIYLGEKMIVDGESYPLAGVFPAVFGLEKKPQAHGYTILETVADNPFYVKGSEIKGHEFRYSKVLQWNGGGGHAFRMKRGVGFKDGMDGLVYKNVLALYTHVHALGTPDWAPSFAARAREYRKGC